MEARDFYDIADLIIKITLIWEDPENNMELTDLIAKLIQNEVENLQNNLSGRANH